MMSSLINKIKHFLGNGNHSKKDRVYEVKELQKKDFKINSQKEDDPQKKESRIDSRSLLGSGWCDICKRQVSGKIRAVWKSGSAVYICDKHKEFYGGSY